MNQELIPEEFESLADSWTEDDFQVDFYNKDSWDMLKALLQADIADEIKYGSIWDEADRLAALEEYENSEPINGW